MNKAGFTTHTLVPGIFLADKLEFFYTFYGLVAMPFLTMPIASHIFGKEQIEELLNERWRTHVVRYMMLLLEP